ncbi:hypothetical protein [Bacteroides fluxus]|uniref:Conserved domain protein n=1 Tax=Bacteroides fluxus YIT 12057 TaxID=763034 RepID=F3PUP5_9BACE|nr:hypothetical protein [Bacteroides fluxus]EGF55988.1 conserved domain protein [Bacteroides fluxus YIT 12057]
MSKIKPYKESVEKSQTVSEPMVAYGAVERNAEDYLKDIPQDTMQSLVDLAIEDYEMGRCTPHSQMDS